jgi:hypothetical protein
MVDHGDQRVGRGGEKGVDIQLDVRAALSDRAVIAAPNAGECESRTRVISLQREPDRMFAAR